MISINEELSEHLVAAKNEIIELKTERSQAITDKEEILHDIKTEKEISCRRVNELNAVISQIKRSDINFKLNRQLNLFSESKTKLELDPEEGKMVSELKTKVSELTHSNELLSLKLSQVIEQVNVYQDCAA